MKRLLLGGLVAVLVLGCGGNGNGDETEERRELCAQYCDKARECDPTGNMTAELTAACKAACAEIYGEDAKTSADPTLDSLLDCATTESCKDFQTCLEGHDYNSGDDGDAADGDNQTDGDASDGEAADGDSETDDDTQSEVDTSSDGDATDSDLVEDEMSCEYICWVEQYQGYAACGNFNGCFCGCLNSNYICDNTNGGVGFCVPCPYSMCVQGIAEDRDRIFCSGDGAEYTPSVNCSCGCRDGLRGCDDCSAPDGDSSESEISDSETEAEEEANSDCATWQQACRSLFNAAECGFDSETVCVAAVDSAANDPAQCQGKAETVHEDYCLPVDSCPECAQFPGTYCGLIECGTVFRQGITIEVVAQTGVECGFVLAIEEADELWPEGIAGKGCEFNFILDAGSDYPYPPYPAIRVASRPTEGRLLVQMDICGSDYFDLTKTGCESRRAAPPAQSVPKEEDRP